MDFNSLPVGGPSTAFGANLLDDDFDESRFLDLSSFPSSQFSTNSGEIPETQLQQHQQLSQVFADSDLATIYEGKVKSRRSWIWKHESPVKVGNKSWWRCNLCPPLTAKMYVDTSTCHQMDHLRNRHRLTKEGRLPAPGERSGLIQQAFGNTAPRIQFNNQIFQELLLIWMLLSNISFRQV